MGMYEEGLAIMEQWFGAGKDNLISLATVALPADGEGGPRPAVRTVDAYYEDGVFYAVTDARSNKMRQIAENASVSVCSQQEMFTAEGKGENLGWVLAPRNAAIRGKIRAAFSEWYDMANNENDENCCFLAVRLTTGTVNVNHWEKLYYMDFSNGVLMADGH